MSNTNKSTEVESKFASKINKVSFELTELIKEAKFKKEEIDKLKLDLKNLKVNYNVTIKEWNSLTFVIINQERAMEESENKIAKYKSKQQVLLSEITMKSYNHLKDISKEVEKKQILQDFFQLVFYDYTKDPFDLIRLLKNDSGIKGILEYSEVIYSNLVKEDNEKYNNLVNLFNNNIVNNLEVMNQFPFNLFFEYIGHIFSIIENKISRDKQKETIDENIIIKNNIFLNLKKLECEIQRNEMLYKAKVKYIRGINTLSDKFAKIKNSSNNESEVENLISTIEKIKNIDINNYVFYDNMSSLSVQSEYSCSEIASIQSNQSFMNNIATNRANYQKDNKSSIINLNNNNNNENNNNNNYNSNTNINNVKNKQSMSDERKESYKTINVSMNDLKNEIKKKTSKIFQKNDSKNKISTINNNSYHSKKKTFAKEQTKNSYIKEIKMPGTKADNHTPKKIEKLNCNCNGNNNNILSNVKSQRHLPKPFLNQKTSLKVSVAENSKLSKKSSFHSLKLVDNFNDKSSNGKNKIKNPNNINSNTDIENSIINRSGYMETENSNIDKSNISIISESKATTKNKNKNKDNKNNKEKGDKNNNNKTKSNNNNKSSEDKSASNKDNNQNKKIDNIDMQSENVKIIDNKTENENIEIDNDLESMNIRDNKEIKIKKINTMNGNLPFNKNKNMKKIQEITATNNSIGNANDIPYNNDKLFSKTTNITSANKNINNNEENENDMSDEKYDDGINEEENNDYIENVNVNNHDNEENNNINQNNVIVDENNNNNNYQNIQNQNENNLIKFQHAPSNSFIIQHSQLLNEQNEIKKLISHSDKKNLYLSNNEQLSDDEDDDDEDEEINNNNHKHKHHKKPNFVFIDDNNNLMSGQNSSHLFKESICDEMISSSTIGGRRNTNPIFIASSGYIHHKTTRGSYVPNVDKALKNSGLPIKKKRGDMYNLKLEKSTEFTCCSSGCSNSVI